MEVKPGYKQTEVGVIPQDWRIASIEEIAAVGRGRVISHRDIARANNPQFPIYSSQTSHDGVMGFIDTYDFEGEYVTWTTDGANAGTVFARNGRFNCTNVCGTIKLKIDNHIFVARVLSRFAPKHVSRHLGNPKLMNDIMKRVRIPLPSRREEQDGIAAALSDVDALLAGLDCLFAKQRDLKQAAMQQLLTGQTRLPGFQGEWEIKPLGELVRIQKGQLITAKTLVSGDVPVIAGGKQPAYFHAVANRVGRTITISASGASAGYVAIYDRPIFASDCSTIGESEGYALDFVYYQLSLNQELIYKAQTGGAQPHIHAKDLNPILFSCRRWTSSWQSLKC